MNIVFAANILGVIQVTFVPGTKFPLVREFIRRLWLGEFGAYGVRRQDLIRLRPIRIALKRERLCLSISSFFVGTPPVSL